MYLWAVLARTGALETEIVLDVVASTIEEAGETALDMRWGFEDKRTIREWGGKLLEVLKVQEITSGIVLNWRFKNHRDTRFEPLLF